MSEETTYVSLTYEELDRLAEGSAKRGADRALDEIREQMRDLYSSLQLIKGIVSRQDLALAFGKTAETIRRWAKRHQFEHIDGPDTRKVYYDLQDIKDKVGTG